MPTNHINEKEILSAFDKGQLKSIATKSEMAKLKAAARATAIKEGSGNAPPPMPDLRTAPGLDLPRRGQRL